MCRLVKRRGLLVGGGAPEIEASRRLSAYAKTLRGMDAYCHQAFADALEVIPVTLAENAGLNPVSVVTELRNRHAQGDVEAGVSARKGAGIANMREESVLQPLLVSTSAVQLSAETVKMMLKIDDIVRALSM